MKKDIKYIRSLRAGKFIGKRGMKKLEKAKEMMENYFTIFNKEKEV